ncbi:MAG TPA: PilZ domain-containing protein [Candidatus Sulfotelmatobacter sp.]|jgi:hypothetical protein|nr:PilZ domain-containing protein [Candidatus Sulfotelmatobacter sp.]
MLLETRAASHAAALEEAVRRHPRILFSVPITLRHLVAGGVKTSHGITLDLSEDGMGALVEGSLHIGDTVALELTLPDCALSAVAIVRHSSTLRSGFEFLGLTAEERVHIADVVGHC